MPTGSSVGLKVAWRTVSRVGDEIGLRASEAAQPPGARIQFLSPSGRTTVTAINRDVRQSLVVIEHLGPPAGRISGTGCSIRIVGLCTRPSRERGERPHASPAIFVSMRLEQIMKTFMFSWYPRR